MSVSAFRDSDESQRGFLGVSLRAGAVNIADRDDDIRRHAAKEAYSSDNRLRCQYVDALNLLRPTELLQEEFQFLASEQQPRRDPGRSSNNNDDDSDDADTISTSLTGMHLENGRAQRLGHLKKIRNTFDRHNESPAQPLPDRKNRSRGCRGGRGTPQKPDEDLLRSLQDDSRAVDPSDMTSDPGTPRSYGFVARPNAGNRQDNLAGPSTPNTNRRANAPSPVTPNTNTNNNALRTRPATPSGGDGIFSPAPNAAKRMRSLQRQRAAVMDNYKEALKALTDNDVRMREIDAEMRLLSAGAGVVEEEDEEEGDSSSVSASSKAVHSVTRLAPSAHPDIDMVKSNFFADATADTFHGVKIVQSMRLSYSASEKTKIRAHIIRHQLTKASPDDFHLAELHKALGIADLGQKYVDVIYPKIASALKARIEELSNQKGCNEMLEGVKDGDQTRFYPPALDAWTLPTWQGDVTMADAPDMPDADDQGQDHDPKEQQQDIIAGQPPPPPPPPPPPSPSPVFHSRVSPREELLPPADLQPSTSRARPAGPGLRPSRASEPIESHRPTRKDKQPVSLRPADITPPTRDRILPSQTRLGGQSQRSGFGPSVNLPTPPATVVKPRQNRMTLPPDDDEDEHPLPSRRLTPPPDDNNEAELLPQYHFLLEKLAELHLELRHVQGDEIMALWRGRNNNNGRAQTMRNELRLLEDQTDHLRKRAALLREGLDIIVQELVQGIPGAQGGSHVLGATVDLLLLGFDL
ncbi:hypothetical protein CCHR01_17565 [Colletotrichum chrysophilum]|uniref:Uncharacterized protein n=1 Tax=Colletotrichum chrysophilum TaxID=1836956 RepID=A0AAD9A1Z1_9PEZI|nr:hypothetical protein CCHR01_17565 [Colletotrichum chrysophilum]